MTRSVSVLLKVTVPALLLLALLAGSAMAQEFQKIDAPVRQEMPASPLVAAAYGFIWLAVLVYVLFVARGLARVGREIAELERKVADATTTSPSK